MIVKEAIEQMRQYDRDFLIAIVIGLMFEDVGIVTEESVLDDKNIIRMEEMQSLFEKS